MLGSLAMGGDEDEFEERQRACDSLIMCIVTTLNQGLRNGGGIGDVLRKPSSQVQLDGVVVVTCLMIVMVRGNTWCNG